MFYHLRATLFLLFFFLITVNLIGQENPEPSPKFTIGAFLSGDPSQTVLDMYDSTGFNYAAWGAYSNTNSFLSNYDVWAMNAGFNTDWISYYATCYYSKWEGEQDEPWGIPNEDMHVGVKHKYGRDTTWHDTTCWSSLGVTAPACSLMFGPHYRQDQRHKSWYHTGHIKGVDYYTRFNLALDNPDSLNPDKNICVLKVVYRYAEVYNTTPPSWTLHDSTFLRDTLKISDFPRDGSFHIFDFNNRTYRYPDTFYSAIVGDKMSRAAAFPEDFSVTDTVQGFSHNNPDNGIQFWVDYLGNDSTTLFIDYAEVYDSAGWDHYIENPQRVADTIQSYVQRYSGWSNIKYWYGQDEPYSIDSFTPIHIVDSLTQYYGGAIVTQYVQPTGMCNGDTFMVDYYHMAKPEEIIIDPYPYGPAYTPVRWEDLEWIREQFQISSSLQPGFGFIGQTFGEKIDTAGAWYIWRLPDSTELKSSLMLALAHGVKRLFFWIFNSHISYDYQLEANIYTYGMVNEDGSPTELWYLLHNDIIPRLEGRLGDILLALNYTGNYISARYIVPTDNPAPRTYDYLTLPHNQTSTTINWHAGFFNRNGYGDDKYFFLANLLPETNKSVLIGLTPPVSGFTNFRFRNYEGYFDTTFTGSSFSYTINHPAGEGYLYEVAPIIKYGGKLY